MKPNEVLFKEAYTIINYAKKLDNELDEVIDLIYDYTINKTHIVITGIGKNSDIAKKASATFSSLGIPSFYLDSYESLHGDLGSVISNQLIVGISKSGSTFELIETFKSLGEKGCKLISISCNENSDIGNIAVKYNGLNIVIPCEFEADELNIAPTCSSTLLIAVLDAIGCVVSQKLNFTKNDFLKNHPAGALGKMLRGE